MKMKRPEPPDLSPGSFAPAPDLADWARRAFLEPESPFWSEDHEALGAARIVWCWTSAVAQSRGRAIIGQAELAGAYRKRWRDLREERWVAYWWETMPDFAPGTPDFLITLYAPWCAEAADRTFCALVDHELSHCAVAEDGYGLPRREVASGRPVWRIVGHDVEEFVGVVQRWGAASPEVERLVAAARRPPEFGPAELIAGCGTCRRAA